MGHFYRLPTRFSRNSSLNVRYKQRFLLLSALPFSFFTHHSTEAWHSSSAFRKREGGRKGINKQKSTILLMIETTTSKEMENVQRQSISHRGSEREREAKRKRKSERKMGRCIVIYFIFLLLPRNLIQAKEVCCFLRSVMTNTQNKKREK